MMRYERDGFSYWAVIRKQCNSLIGVSGLLVEKTDDDNETHIGIGYIIHQDFWNKGYAAECASACARYAFEGLKMQEVTAQIRADNLPSRKVAEKIGMSVKKEFVRQYQGKDVPHLLYCLAQPNQPL